MHGPQPSPSTPTHRVFASVIPWTQGADVCDGSGVGVKVFCVVSCFFFSFFVPTECP